MADGVESNEKNRALNYPSGFDCGSSRLVVRNTITKLLFCPSENQHDSKTLLYIVLPCEA